MEINWFWTTALVVLVIGLFLVVSADRQNISFSDLETECRYDRVEESTVSLTDRGTLKFEGMFPVGNTDSDIDYRYSQSSGRIELDITSSGREAPVNFTDNCLGTAIYSGETDRLPEKDFMVVLKHDGKEVEKKVIRVK